MFNRVSIPRILPALLWLPIASTANDIYSRADAFEYTNLTNVRSSPIWSNNAPDQNNQTFDPLNVFGSDTSTQEVGNGEFVFSEYKQPDNIDWIEFETLQAVPLTGYKVYLKIDIGRKTSLVVLKGDKDQDGTFEELDRFEPLYSTPGIIGVISETTRTLSTPYLSRSWRLEFYRDPVYPNGQRIIEVDAVTMENPGLPTVEITSPAPESKFLVGADVPINVSASDEGQVNRVELVLNGKKVATINQGASYSFVLRNLPLGAHQVTARAVDNLGGESETSLNLEVTHPTPETRLSPSRAADGFIHFDIVGGIEGQTQTILGSSDLMEWTPIKTAIYPGEKWTYSAPIESAYLFYKLSQ